MSASPIAAMFDSISPQYDRLNHLLSLNIDKSWRRKTAKMVVGLPSQSILDIASGTADLAIAIAKRNPNSHIIGVDISEKMLAIGKAKIEKQGFSNQIELRLGDAAALPFEDNSFDIITVAFGVRNFENRNKSLSEIHRVLKPKGMVLILEFSMPTKFPLKPVYRFYFKHILPMIGKWMSKDANAYTYLPESVNQFPIPTDFMRMLSDNHLIESSARHLSGGIAILYSAIKG